ncbi:MAG: biopolymer transporter ExbD [Sphingomonadales bacterium 32-68-7]|nr:MAG: biopolymer transporter ExbD [Sphingomonadales bacterium 12-68-11]OYX08579.1 MAG: biopolymer transporter ExbD [Sphingomonadales bacterium 32-68-7]
MAFASTSSGYAPIGEINTTPLIDVLLVLLIVFVMSIPVATHEVPIDLPGPPDTFAPLPADPIRNKIVVTRTDAILWNGEPVSPAELVSQLSYTRNLSVEPELQFEPEALASYDLSAKVLGLIKRSGITKFGFVGNEKYQQFGK